MSEELALNGRGDMSHSATVESNKGIAEVQARMAIAKRFPRDTVRALDAIKNACARKGLAEKALYSFARGGSDVTGPSIRLAEALAQQWGNLDHGILERETTKEGSLVEAFCWDMETNLRVSKVFTVPHVRHTKSGSRPLTDPRDIYENVANNGARRLRACILGVIPGDVVEAAVEWCNATLKASCKCGPEEQKVMLERFKEVGVTREQIEAKIQRRLDAIQPAQFIMLRNIFTAIHDGMAAPADYFAVPDLLTGSAKTKAALGLVPPSPGPEATTPGELAE
jgi:hypothetical protein